MVPSFRKDGRVNAVYKKKKHLFPSDDIEFRGTMHTQEFIRTNARAFFARTDIYNFALVALGVNALFCSESINPFSIKNH